MKRYKSCLKWKIHRNVNKITIMIISISRIWTDLQNVEILLNQRMKINAQDIVKLSWNFTSYQAQNPAKFPLPDTPPKHGTRAQNLASHAG